MRGGAEGAEGGEGRGGGEAKRGHEGRIREQKDPSLSSKRISQLIRSSLATVFFKGRMVKGEVGDGGGGGGCRFQSNL